MLLTHWVTLLLPYIRAQFICQSCNQRSNQSRTQESGNKTFETWSVGDSGRSVCVDQFQPQQSNAIGSCSTFQSAMIVHENEVSKPQQ